MSDFSAAASVGEGRRLPSVIVNAPLIILPTASASAAAKRPFSSSPYSQYAGAGETLKVKHGHYIHEATRTGTELRFNTFPWLFSLPSLPPSRSLSLIFVF